MGPQFPGHKGTGAGEQADCRRARLSPPRLCIGSACCVAGRRTRVFSPSQDLRPRLASMRQQRGPAEPQTAVDGSLLQEQERGQAGWNLEKRGPWPRGVPAADSGPGPGSSGAGGAPAQSPSSVWVAALRPAPTLP